MSTLAELQALAITIKNETQLGANSATRIGGVLEGVIENLITIAENIDPLPLTLNLEAPLVLTSGHRYININGGSEPRDLLLPSSSSALGRIHTVINSGNIQIRLVPANYDNLNGMFQPFTILASAGATIVSFGDQGWFIVNQNSYSLAE